MNFSQSLDKYLTTPPEDNFDLWCDLVVEHLSNDFFEENEDWIMTYNGQCERWLNKLINREPKQAANIIERAFKIYNNDTRRSK